MSRKLKTSTYGISLVLRNKKTFEDYTGTDFDCHFETSFFLKLQLYDLTLEEVIFYNMVYDMQKMTKSIHCLRHES